MMFPSLEDLPSAHLCLFFPPSSSFLVTWFHAIVMELLTAELFTSHLVQR